MAGEVTNKRQICGRQNWKKNPPPPQTRTQTGETSGSQRNMRQSKQQIPQERKNQGERNQLFHFSFCTSIFYKLLKT
ncbi:MAG: hypothetical protein R2941_24470 [Desulfobacterales bacterium]